MAQRICREKKSWIFSTFLILVFIQLIPLEISAADLTEDNQQQTVREADPLLSINPETDASEEGEQYNPEFSESLVEKLNPSSTIEVLQKSRETQQEESSSGHHHNHQGTINETSEEASSSSSEGANDERETNIGQGLRSHDHELTTNQTGQGQNETEKSSTANNNVTEAKQLRCVLRILSEGEIAEVHLTNASSLIKALSPVPNVTNGECALVMFYSPWCPFSAKAAPHFNALPRLYPHFSFYALDAVSHTALNMRYGLVAIPTVLLFHNGKAIVKYNESEPLLEKLVGFIEKYTGISPRSNATLLAEDSEGPVSSVQALKTDYLLLLSWLFIIICFCWWFLKSSLCHRIVDSVRNTWREAEAHHQHVD